MRKQVANSAETSDKQPASCNAGQVDLLTQLRQALQTRLDDGESVRSICRQSGVDLRQLQRFRDGEQIGIVVASRLSVGLGLSLQPDQPSRKRRSTG